jgi:16S rRNA (cytidine1402-2'-O)-methyltransferase
MVGTPIGHLGDLSFRALDTLKQAAVIACEDTRRTRRLLTHYSIDRPVVSLHAHSASDVVERLLDRVAAGESVAYVTDAGTPVISDPGGQLAERAHARGLVVVPVPGPGAVLTALSAAGFPADRFVFLGFLPKRGGARAELLRHIADGEWTAVCYEAPGRLAQLLADLAGSCGAERPAAVARELTKLHEEVRRGTLAELGAYYRAHPPRGEITVVIGGRGPGSAEPAPPAAPQEVEAALAELKGTDTPAAIAKELARRLGISRQDAYRLLTR